MYRSLTICYFEALLLRLSGLSNFHHPLGESLLIKLRGMTCPARLARQITFSPQCLGFLIGSWMLWGDRDCIYWNMWVCYAFWHLAPFNAVEASFGCSTSKNSCHSCCHNGAFSFPCNRRFGCRRLHLEGGRFEFWESRLLIQWSWIFELLSFRPFEFRPLDEKLRGYPRN